MPATDGAQDGERYHINTLTLPTGAVLVLGGQNKQNGQAMLSPLIYRLGVWYVDVPNAVFSNRMYHAAAVLLDDGRVAIGGGDARNYDYEVYSPYYLLRPAIDKPVNLTFQGPVLPPHNPEYNADELNYGSTYVIQCTIAAPNVAVQKAVLISPGSMTHASDMHQRYVELSTTVTVTGTTNQVQFVLAANEDLAPRGLYMLWLVTNSEAVSDATWVVLR
jgi:hypothetical protein